MVFNTIHKKALLIPLAIIIAITIIFRPSVLIAEAGLSDLSDKSFGDISIVIKDIFDPPENSFFRSVNSLKVSTREKVVKKELLFKSGDPYDPFLVQESERVLRTLRFLREIKIREVHNGNLVDIIVEVQDTWTIIPQASYSSGDGRNRRSIGIAEGNIMGTGKRLEALYREDEATDSLQFAYDDRRLFGSKYQGQFSYTDSSDGHSVFYDLGLPYRSLVQPEAYGHSLLVSDTVERLYENGDERFIYRKMLEDFNAYYSHSIGEPSAAIRRFTFGARYLSERFLEATLEDFESIDLDPSELPENGGTLAENRRFAGPSIGYDYIEEDYIKSRYIDRFSRYEDFNLGNRLRLSSTIAPEFLGSIKDTLLLRGSFGNGFRIGSSSFFRWETGANSRLNSNGFENSIFNLEGQYFRRIGQVDIGGLSLGNHTLIVRTLLDYAHNLDDNKEFLVGGDNFLRGYRARTFTGDKRFAVNAEDRIHLFENVFDLISIGAAVFAEAGGATTSPLPDLFTDNIYADVGFGLRLAFPRSSGERILRLDLAFPLREGDDGSQAFQLRAIFSGGQLFNARLPTEEVDATRVAVEFKP